MRRTFLVLSAAILSAATAAALAGCGSSASSGTAAASETASTAASGSSEAQETSSVDWPKGDTIHFEVPFKAGGNSDIQCRYIADAWKKQLDGVNIIVDNYDTSEVGLVTARDADPDGMTFTMVNSTNMDAYFAGTSEVSTKDDFTQVVKLSDGIVQAVIAKPDAPYSNFKELGDYAKEHPGEVVTGCTLGGASQLIFENISAALGDVELNYVQCAAESDKLTNIPAGSLDIAIVNVASAKEYLDAGKLKVLGTITPSDEYKKADIEKLLGTDLPDDFLPTGEQGITDACFPSGTYLVMPAGAEEGLVSAINESLLKLADDEEFVNNMKSTGSLVHVENLEDTRKDFDAEWDLQKNLTTAAGIYSR